MIKDLIFYVTNFEIYVDYIQGKPTNKSKKGATKSSTILEIIYDIFYSNMDSHVKKYFIFYK